MTNYKYLKIEEKEIIEKFNGFLLEVITFYEKEYTNYINHTDSQKMFEEAIEIDKKNIKHAHDILDECVWFIQKNEPRTSHLRLIIAVINSLIDIKRISSYVVTFCKFYNKQIDAKSNYIFKRIVEVGQLSIDTTKKLYDLIEEYNLDTLSVKANLIFDDFIEQYKMRYVESITDSLKNKTINSKFVASTIIVIKNFDRFVDHMMNIVENLVNIY